MATSTHGKLIEHGERLDGLQQIFSVMVLILTEIGMSIGVNMEVALIHAAMDIMATLSSQSLKPVN